MATYTTNYQLKKPAAGDFYNIEDFNGNTDIIDAKLKRGDEARDLVEELSQSQEAVNDQLSRAISSQNTTLTNAINSQNTTLTNSINSKTGALSSELNGVKGNVTALQSKTALTACVLAPQGTAVTMSLGGSSVSGTAGSGMELVLTLPAIGKWRMNYSYGGASYAKDVAIEHIGQTRCVAAPSLAAAPWAYIGKISREGLAREAWRLGDCKSVSSSIGTLNMQLVGFSQDRLTSPSLGNETAGMTFIQNGVSGSSYYYHNVYQDTACNWLNSYLRTTVFAGIYNSLPADLRGVIRTVRKFTKAGDNSNAYSDDNLWLPSEYELYGISVIGKNYQGQVWYDYYKVGMPPSRSAGCWLRTHDYRSNLPYYVAYMTANTAGLKEGDYDMCTREKPLFVGFCV